MTNKPTHEIEEPSKEFVEAVEILDSFAASFGITLEHYGRTALHITFDGDKEYDWWFPEGVDSESSEDDGEEASAELEGDLSTDDEDPSPVESTSEENSRLRPKEPTSIYAQLAQIHTFLHPKVKAAFGSSALYPIMSAALSALGRTGKTLEEKINGMGARDALGAWLFSRRAFAYRHSEDMTRMLDALVAAFPAEGKPSVDLPALEFEPVTDKDIETVTAFCERYLSALEELKAKEPEAAPAADMDRADPILQEITELSASDNIILMQSKVARKLITIGNTSKTISVSVGKPSRPVEVVARIEGRNGEKTASLNRIDYDVMEAIGQIIDECGKPVLVTPQQIYHKITASAPTTNVSPQAIKEIVDSMDKLLFTPATIDFREEIEKHTKLKKRNKEIENGEVSGTLEGNLISGVHLKRYTAQRKGRAVEHAFMIYDFPMFYYYTKTIGQLVTIPGYLLSGAAPRDKTVPKKAQKAPTAQRSNLKEIGLRRYLLEQIEYFKKLREKQIEKDRRNRTTPRKEHEFMLAFETISTDLGYETDTPKRLRLLREQTYSFLQEQVEKKNIKRCEYYYKGRALSGVTIVL